MNFEAHLWIAIMNIMNKYVIIVYQISSLADAMVQMDYVNPFRVLHAHLQNDVPLIK